MMPRQKEWGNYRTDDTVFVRRRVPCRNQPLSVVVTTGIWNHEVYNFLNMMLVVHPYLSLP